MARRKSLCDNHSSPILFHACLGNRPPCLLSHAFRAERCYRPRTRKSRVSETRNASKRHKANPWSLPHDTPSNHRTIIPGTTLSRNNRKDRLGVGTEQKHHWHTTRPKSPNHTINNRYRPVRKCNSRLVNNKNPKMVLVFPDRVKCNMFHTSNRSWSRSYIPERVDCNMFHIWDKSLSRSSI